MEFFILICNFLVNCFHRLKTIKTCGIKIFLLKFRRDIKQKIISFHSVLDVITINTMSTISLVEKKKSLNLIKGLFISPLDNLSQIRIITCKTHSLKVTIVLKIREGSANGPIIRQIKLTGEKICNNNYSSFIFPPIHGSQNKKFFFECSASINGGIIYTEDIIPQENLKLFNENGSVEGLIGFQAISQINKNDIYASWIRLNEAIKISTIEIKKEILSFEYQPKISIIVPVWNTDEKWLNLAIQSVINQVYENWELCIVDGGSTKSYIKPLLQNYANSDFRIKITFLSENYGIVFNSNEAIKLASGEFIAFLDHDDELSLFALYEVVKKLNTDKTINFVYSDEDKIDTSGKRIIPLFKPDWSPNTLLSHNYICHFVVIRKILVDNVGGFRLGYDGSQDHDLFLRVTEIIPGSTIAHIPKILYHWRMIQGSAALKGNEKPYAFLSSKKALNDYLKRNNKKGEVIDGLFPCSYRIRRDDTNNPSVSIILQNYNGCSITKKVKKIFLNTAYSNFEIVSIEKNTDKDESLYIKKYFKNSSVNIINSEKISTNLNNIITKNSDSDYILFFNQDLEILNKDWLSAMMDHILYINVGIVGLKILSKDYLVYNAGITVNMEKENIQINKIHRNKEIYEPNYYMRINSLNDVSAVSKDCLLIKKDLFSKVGGFDEEIQYHCNLDLCLKVRKLGFSVIYTPFSILIKNKKKKDDYCYYNDICGKEKKVIIEKWGSLLKHFDPYYRRYLQIYVREK